MAAGPGVYVHVPFCRHRCGYCDFAVVTGADEAAMARYVRALRSELARTAAAGPSLLAPPGAAASQAACSGAGASPWPPFASVFIGGGTPTHLDPGVLAGLVRHVRAVLPLADDAEVTVEANPEDIDAAGLAALVGAGLTRLSIGAQSAVGDVLAFLDRRHDVHAPWQAVAAARAAGVSSVSVDLIYGAPAETAADWDVSLRAAVDAGVDHVSCYALTLEPNTPYAARVRQGAQAAPDDDVAAARMARAEQVLAASGYHRYEISNWARPGHESVHNRVYWAGGDYLGAGLGAHGHWRGRRWWNLRGLAGYLAAVEAGRAPVAGAEVLDQAQVRAERLLLGLRRAEGVARAQVAPIAEQHAAALVTAGLLDDDGERLRLTAAGRPLADGVTLRLLG